MVEREDDIETVELNDAGIEALALRLLRMSESAGRRVVVGIAGIGGSGKSTAAEMAAGRVRGLVVGELDEVAGANAVAEVNAVAGAKPQAAEDFVRVVAMDGFHFANEELNRRGLREVKGSPATFDAAAYVALLRTIRDEGDVRFPIYDRAAHEPRTTEDVGHAISPGTRIVITEGNYLLLAQPPWSVLGDVLDECWLLDTPVAVARQWLLDRHVAGGRDESDAARHYDRADKPNAELIRASMRRPDLRLRWPTR